MSAGCRAVTILALGVLLQVAVGGCARDKTKYPELRARNGVVTVDLSGIGAESGRFHTYRSSSGKMVDFFVYRESSGVPHAVLDACRTCYRWKKGYVLDGKEVVCLKCDMRFKLDGLAQGTGSCVPVALKTEQSAGHADHTRRGTRGRGAIFLIVPEDLHGEENCTTLRSAPATSNASRRFTATCSACAR